MKTRAEQSRGDAEADARAQEAESIRQHMRIPGRNADSMARQRGSWEPAPATPGRFISFDSEDETGILDVGDEGKAFVGNIRTPDFARLICAAVNACREAGYTVDDLEAGQLQGDKALADRKWASMDERACDQWDRDCADLAACRDALADIAGRLAFHVAGKLPADLHAKSLEQARALLARLAS